MGSAAASPVLTTRADLAAFADDLLAAVRPFASDGHALITLPGRPGGSGTWVDGLEGFARTFLLAGFRLAGESGADPHGLAEWYARGLAAGVDPAAADRWPRPSEAPQAKVEAASIALVLDLTRPWIWDRLAAVTQGRLIDYLAEIVGDESLPRNNWLWFRVVTETFLRSVGGPHDLADIEADLARHDSYYETGGWYRDGADRAYDHYAGWAMHLYPTLWARMSGAGDLASSRIETDRARLDRYLHDAIRLVGADGAPLFQGRSLVYRFATAAPFWAGAIAGVPSVPLGELRRAAFGIINHFRTRGVPNARGLLDLGWLGQWRPMAQWYSGPGSPYWASKGLVGLLLPADHPVWSTPEEEPARADELSIIAAPGWAASSTGGDGLVRIANHGTDYATEGLAEGDDPLYTRLGYSTATAPLLHERARIAPLDQAITFVDAGGRRSHRCGMRLLRSEIMDGAPAPGAGVAVAASRAEDHWVDAPADQFRGSNGGVQGPATPAGATTTISVLRGAWEVRLVRVHEAAPDTALEAGGWPLADDAGVAVTEEPGRIDLETSDGLRARLLALAGLPEQRTEHLDEASPLGAHAAVGVLRAGAPAEPGWFALALALTRAPLTADPRLELDAETARITWPDGATTTLDLTDLLGDAR